MPHDLGHRLQNALVVKGAQSHSLAPAHLLQHVASLIFLAKLRNSRANDFSLPELDSLLPGPAVSTHRSGRLSLRTLEVGAGKIFAMDALRSLADISGCHLGRCEPDGAVGPVKHGTTLVALAGGLRFDVELVRNLVEDLASVVVNRGEFETVCC